MEMNAAHGGGPHQGFPCSLLPGTLSSRGDPLSLVFRTEGVCRRYNQFIETSEFLITGRFPLLTLTMQVDQTNGSTLVKLIF
jgi:hypothetical protein